MRDASYEAGLALLASYDNNLLQRAVCEATIVLHEITVEPNFRINFNLLNAAITEACDNQMLSFPSTEFLILSSQGILTDDPGDLEERGVILGFFVRHLVLILTNQEL